MRDGTVTKTLLAGTSSQLSEVKRSDLFEVISSDASTRIDLTYSLPSQAGLYATYGPAPFPLRSYQPSMAKPFWALQSNHESVQCRALSRTRQPPTENRTRKQHSLLCSGGHDKPDSPRTDSAYLFSTWASDWSTSSTGNGYAAFCSLRFLMKAASQHDEKAASQHDRTGRAVTLKHHLRVWRVVGPSKLGDPKPSDSFGDDGPPCLANNWGVT